jgi:Rrf2 family protein
MTMLSRKIDYALLILSHLHHHPEGGSAREIAARFALSRAFVANILKVLCHKGFVTSHRGVKGGYAFQRPAEAIRLADLLEALDESFHLVECTKVEREDICSLVNICPMKSALSEVHRRIREVLRNITLGELFRSPTPVPAGETQFGLAVATLGRQLATATP